MHTNQYIKRCCLIIILFISFQGFSQLSKTHYIPPLTNSPSGNANPEDQYIYLSTPSVSDISYTIMPVGQPTTSYITGTVSNTNSRQIAIGTGNGQLFVPSTITNRVINDRGYIIEAEGTIYVSVRMNAGGAAQAGALVSKGLSALGNTFRIGSYTNQNPSDNYLNFFSVMATEDNTVVSFPNISNTLTIEGPTTAETVPANVTLNKGESYTVATRSDKVTANRDGLIGTLITSDKYIVVNCGSTNGSFGTGGGRDYGIDQIVDLTKVGTEYIFVRGNGNDAWENVLIVPHTDNTAIYVNGSTTPIATINADDYYVIEGNLFDTNGNMYVETSQPVFAYQGIGGTGNNGSPNEANQGMFFVPPLSCEARGNLDNIAQINNIGSTNYSGGVSVVTKDGATVLINGSPISSFSTIGPNIVNGKTDYITYKVTNLSGDISVESTDELYCAYFNYNGSATSGSFYSGFPSAPEINFDTQFATIGNCIPNVTLEAANTENFDSYEWLFDDGSGFEIEASNVPSITPTLPGKYKLRGIITCTGVPLESAEVPVSMCPDDIDNDGIIDNLDIDNDNDGILNCTESRRDVILDLSDTRPPILRFEDNTSNTTIASNNIYVSDPSINDVRITGSGDIISEIVQDNNGENIYDISFTEPVNVKFSEDDSYTHNSVDDEYFIVKILPINKNITLIDLDDRLLVDSNFDGVFETGITQISGSEIHFKYNTTPNGNTPFEFFANQVDSFSFVHKLENINVTSNFQANISLTCFKLDTDLDGIPDSLDFDSDNDGIPDIIEKSGTLVTLSNIDANLDGLDDIFDISDTPIDTDNDGVLDFYDLDSDNDGIYDINEADPLFSVLSDTGTLGIDDGPVFGINGWTDRAETTPDSNLIAYTPDDTDADGIFSYIDLDSDGDGCNDVIEADFTDLNDNGFLGYTPVTTDVDSNGKVTGAGAIDGYTVLPNNNFIIGAPITISTQPMDDKVCESSTHTFTITSPDADTYQWEVRTDGDSNWNIIIDDAVYSNSATQNLTLTNTPLTFNTYQYRVKLDRNGNSCGIYSETAILTVNPLPVINSPVILIQCDDDIDGISFFNLTEANDEISNNTINETFTYFLSSAAAVSGDMTSPDYIATPTTYENSTSPFTDSVWARIESTFSCSRISNIQLSVGTSQIPTGAINEVLYKCDDFLDINGNNNIDNNDRDGIATFDFSYVQTTVENFFLPQTPIVTFYRNEADALTESNAITDTANYRNIGYPNTQQIYVRVDSQISNDCQAFGPYITLNVEPLPVANPVTIARACDFDTTDTDISYPFDTSSIENTVLNGQSLTDVTVEYFDALGNQLPSPLPNPFTTASQTISIRVTNNITQDSDGPCSDETTLEFIVDEQPVIADAVEPQIFCDGSAADIVDNGIYPFDTSTFTSRILGTQDNMEIYFDYTDEDGIAITNSTTLPNPLNSENQTIDVYVINPINPLCSASTTIDLIVNPLPEFTLEEEILTCALPFVPFDLEPVQENPLETFIYEWTFEDGSVLGNDLILSNIANPGKYTIKLTNTTTTCEKSLIVDVKAADPPNISITDLEISDLVENNSVTIIDPSSLGNSTYVFSLLSEDGDVYFPYQISPVFNNVRAGFYTLFVQDSEAVCAEVELPISVIGHRKFFTPNGDGENDYWQIQGLDISEANSIIHIFDRYGKLIKQLSPLSDGWDGTFNGNLMPTDDYWFKLMLVDGRSLMGHFSLKR